MRGRHPTRRSQQEVQLNLAAMLDMAFQLLAFFILTFRPAPVEGYIALRMPPAQPLTKPGQTATQPTDVPIPTTSLPSVMVTVTSQPDGEIGSIRIEEGQPVASLSEFEQQLSNLLSVPDATFDQLVLQVGSRLHYENLMRVLDVCSRIKFASGEHLTKLSIVELPDAGE
ncbi:MAG: biopolymer transporter ExbD [Planctomycetia bacterium]|nr:biopolymer transporter ExbD [Planctomycetia bacterium]